MHHTLMWRMLNYLRLKHLCDIWTAFRTPCVPREVFLMQKLEICTKTDKYLTRSSAIQIKQNRKGDSCLLCMHQQTAYTHYLPGHKMQTLYLFHRGNTTYAVLLQSVASQLSAVPDRALRVKAFREPVQRKHLQLLSRFLLTQWFFAHRHSIASWS